MPLDAGRRVAVEIRYAAAVEFRSAGLPGASEAASAVLKGLVAGILSKADVARTNGQADWLTTIGEVVVDMNGRDLSSAGTAAAQIRQRSAAFEERLTKALAGPVPSEIADLFANINEAVAGIYADLAIVIRQPRTELQLGWLHADQREGVLDSTAVDGACAWQDEGEPLSIITLSIRDDGFDWPSACQLVYVISHELVCHAYQGLMETGNSRARSQVDQSCSWSEGWMDVIALWLVETWVQSRCASFPQWIGQHRTGVVAACQALSARRTEVQLRLRPGERQRRIFARDGIDRLRYELEKFDDAETAGKGQQRAIAFSLTLNSINMTQKDRVAFVDHLVNALQLWSGPHLDQLVSEILAFTVTGDLTALHSTITECAG